MTTQRHDFCDGLRVHGLQFHFVEKCVCCFGDMHTLLWGSPGLLATHFHEVKTDGMALFSFHGKLYVLVWGGAGPTHFLRMEMEGGPRLLS